ncbi:hypothetical protein [uncultured Parabacteroides sp.]|nr:hypothetical protein [uncultured Parabacteroides sp.]
MKVSETKEAYTAVVVNKSGVLQTIALKTDGKKRLSEVLFADKGGAVNGDVLTVHPEETLVVCWKK